MNEELSFSRITSLLAVDPVAWDALLTSDNPFVQHRFLYALERSGCTSESTGWEADHLLACDTQGVLVGAVPRYRKWHSAGEFVFDWGWADAAQRANINYYPKSVVGVPFTPVEGPRLLSRNPQVRSQLAKALFDSSADIDSQRTNSTHLLFASPDDDAAIADWQSDNAANNSSCDERLDCHFEWLNPGVESFSEFVEQLPRKQRKNIRRERRRLSECGIHVHALPANELSAEEWATAMQCYARTYQIRGQQPYLNEEFWRDVADQYAAQLICFAARLDGALIAVAFAFDSGSQLFGRHWGCLQEIDGLHFETCYYSPIEYAIERGYRRFDAGVQGSHKLKRGFRPYLTRSWHQIAHPGLSEAVGNYLSSERVRVHEMFQDLSGHAEMPTAAATPPANLETG